MRPRLNRNRTLPPNLHHRRDGYYIYVEPARSIKDPGHRHILGRDRLKAMEIARELNMQLIPIRDVVQAILSAPVGKTILVNQLIPKFIEYSSERVANGHLKASTLKAWANILKRVNTALGDRRVDSIDTHTLAQFLKPIPPRMANVFRIILMQMFRYAIGEGFIKTNPVDDLMTRDYKVKRERLTLDQFWDVHANAAPMVQIAMELFLHTLQRPIDLVRFKFSDFTDGKVLVTQEKTGTKVSLPVSKSVVDLIQRARSLTDAQGFPVVSEYVLHKVESVKSKQRGKPVTTEWLSKAFAEARDQCESMQAMAPDTRPTFYEIRSLGADLYDQQGINPQKGLGHLTETMTRLYLSRRKERVLEFKGELDIKKPHGGSNA